MAHEFFSNFDNSSQTGDFGSTAHIPTEKFKPYVQAKTAYAWLTFLSGYKLSNFNCFWQLCAVPGTQRNMSPDIFSSVKPVDLP